MLAFLPLLLADLADVLRVVMPIIFVVIYGVAHLVGAMQQEKKKREQTQQRSEPPEPDPFDMGRPAAGAPHQAGLDRPGANPAPAAKPVTLEETLRREVEEFLRRAQGGQQPKQTPKQKQRSQQRPAPAKKPQQPQPEEAQPRRLVNAPGSLTGRTAESVADTTRNNLPTGAAVDAYVTDQMRGVSAIGQHASRLGEEVAQADDRMLAQLQQKFDHQVGTLAPATTSTAKTNPAANAAREFRELLARPGGMRQVIIANEILRRPEERW